MAGKMMLVNPRKRSRRKTNARKRRSPARSRARRRTTRTPARRTTRAVRRRTKAAPARRRRRNPQSRGAMRFVRPAVTGGATAVGIDVAFGYLPLPDMLSTGWGRHASKAAAAIGLGMFGSNLGIVKRATAESMAQGALTVYAADMLRDGMAQFLPDVPLGYYSPAYVPPQGGGDGVNEYLSGGTPRDPIGADYGPHYDSGVGMYVDHGQQGMPGEF